MYCEIPARNDPGFEFQSTFEGRRADDSWEVIEFLEVQPIEKSWEELMVPQASEDGIRRIAAEAGELMLNSSGPVAGAILDTVFSRLCEEARAA